MKNFYFVKNEEQYEFWVEGKLITDCFSGEEVEELIRQLVYFADIPIYKSIAEKIKKEVDNS